MKRFGKVVAVAALALGLASVARAQLPGVPFYPVSTGTGVMAAADYGDFDDLGTTVGLTGGLGLGRLGISGSVGQVRNGSDEIALAAAAGLRLFGGGLNPLTVGVQAGASTYDPGDGRQNVLMPGVNLRFSFPVLPIKPFAVVYYPMGDATEEVRVTVGTNFNILLGLGVHAAYDWGDSGSGWGVGAHFNFRVPMM